MLLQRLCLSFSPTVVYSTNCAWPELEQPQNEHSCVKDELGVGAGSLFVLLNCKIRCIYSGMRERSRRSWVRSLQYQTVCVCVCGFMEVTQSRAGPTPVIQHSSHYRAVKPPLLSFQPSNNISAVNRRSSIQQTLGLKLNF